MSYTYRDLLADRLPDEAYDKLAGDQYPDDLDRLVSDFKDMAWRKAQEFVYDEAEDFRSDHFVFEHENEVPPDYVRGFYNGLLAAARGLGNW